MIREIRIQNLALIDDLTLLLQPGFTVFTGETGAGKSILVGAISLLLGDRAQSEHIRNECEEATVQGILELPWLHPELQQIFKEGDIPLDDATVIIRRVISRNGRNRIYINQTAVVLSTLRTIGGFLVDLHSQHDHQSLLDPATPRRIIDALAPVEPAATRYRRAWSVLSQLREHLDEYETKTRDLTQKRDFLRFQLEEIASLSLEEGEEERLESESALLTSTADRMECAQAIVTSCSGTQDEAGVIEHASRIRKSIERLSRFDDSISPWFADLDSALAVFTELETSLAAYLASAAENLNPARLAYVNERISRIQRLRKKHGCSFIQLLELERRLRVDLETIDNAQGDRETLIHQAEEAFRQCIEAGETLRQARKQEAHRLCRSITANLRRLGFEDGELRTDFAPYKEAGPTGLDECVFMVRTNPGEPFLPLAKTASGGEISRLMLAIKTACVQEDPVPVLIFDEVDTGIGGMVAHEIAASLRALGQKRQILCISHLHQVAALADTQVRVFKETRQGRTTTRAQELDAQERVKEIERMLGGESQAARNHARELLKKREGSDRPLFPETPHGKKTV